MLVGKMKNENFAGKCVLNGVLSGLVVPMLTFYTMHTQTTALQTSADLSEISAIWKKDLILVTKKTKTTFSIKVDYYTLY